MLMREFCSQVWDRLAQVLLQDVQAVDRVVCEASELRQLAGLACNRHLHSPSRFKAPPTKLSSLQSW